MVDPDQGSLPSLADTEEVVQQGWRRRERERERGERERGGEGEGER